MNKYIAIGRLTADPELRNTQSGVAVCRFTIAVNRPFKNEQTGDYDADFITCVAWKQHAVFISKYFTKGNRIALTGSLRSGSYQDKTHPDVKHFTTEVFIESVEFCADKSTGGQASGPAPNTQQPPTAQSMINQAANAGDETMSYGNLSEFEEILSDGDVPF